MSATFEDAYNKLNKIIQDGMDSRLTYKTIDEKLNEQLALEQQTNEVKWKKEKTNTFEKLQRDKKSLLGYWKTYILQYAVKEPKDMKPSEINAEINSLNKAINENEKEISKNCRSGDKLMKSLKSLAQRFGLSGNMANKWISDRCKEASEDKGKAIKSQKARLQLLNAALSGKTNTAASAKKSAIKRATPAVKKGSFLEKYNKEMKRQEKKKKDNAARRNFARTRGDPPAFDSFPKESQVKQHPLYGNLRY